MGGRGFVAVLAGALAAVCAAAPAAGAAAHFEVGAARVETTPPPRTAASDARDFGACQLVAMTGARPFAFEEPYADSNGNGRFDYGPPPEPFCDANANGRWDGIWSSGKADTPARTVHDPIDARAVAIGDGSRAVVYVSVVAQGLFLNYTDQMRAAAHLPAGVDMVVSANHNEGSPDTIGIYGGPVTPADVGARSGIDELYMSFLAERVGAAARSAYQRRRPASIFARQFRIPAGLTIGLSRNFPTTDDSGGPAAIDPKIGVLQARGADGRPIATVMSLAVHNQLTGQHIPTEISADWPGVFHHELESRVPGMAMFLVGDNGSEEDPNVEPEIECDGEGPVAAAPCRTRATATGRAFARAVAAQAPKADRLRYGRVDFKRTVFDVPLENNGFKALAKTGEFGSRPTYQNGQNAGTAGSDVRTAVATARIGPDLELIDNPAEAFPALMLGSPWGIEDAPCDDRPMPPVPTWRSGAAYRFQVGLADDLIGYLYQPPFFAGEAPIYSDCTTDADNIDSKGHKHKLETESVGPTAGGIVATRSTDLVKRGADPAAQVVRGRFVRADGKVVRRPEGAVAVRLATGRLLALPGFTGFGAKAVDASARMMDYDGAEQRGAGDVTTRGMLVYGCGGRVAARIYLDLYPPLSLPASLGAARRGQVGAGCGAGFGGPRTGPVLPGRGGGVPRRCRDRRDPRARILRRKSRLTRRRMLVRGRARDRGCARLGAVLVTITRHVSRTGRRCRFVRPNGRLTARRRCRRPVFLRAHGRRSWRVRGRARLPRGRYRVSARAVDRRGNRGRPTRVTLRVR